MTIFRVWWLFFAVSLHPMRLDEMIDLASNDVAKWDDTPNAQDGFADEIAERATPADKTRSSGAWIET